MLLETLPITDIYFNTFGSITVTCPETEDRDIVTIEDLVEDFLENCCGEDGVVIIDSSCNLQAAYNILDSLHEAIARIEEAIYDDEDDFEITLIDSTELY